MSFFTSDKDLRKVAPKRTVKRSPSTTTPSSNWNEANGSSNVSVNSKPMSTAPHANEPSISASNQLTDPESLIDHAKREREIRQLKRQQVAYILRIQAWWRGRHSAASFRTSLRQSIQKRIGDVENITKLLYAKNITFVPPLDVTVTIIKEILYLIKYSSRIRYFDTTIVPFCRLFLVPSTSATDLTKNLLPLCGNNVKVGNVVFQFLLMLFSSFSELSASLPLDSYKILLLTIRTILLSSTTVDAGNSVIEKDPSVQRWRKSLITESFFKSARRIFIDHSVHKKWLKMTSTEEFFNDYPALQYHSLSAEDFFVQVKSQLFVGKDGEIHRFLFDSIFSVLVDLTRIDFDRHLPWFIRHILTIPLLTAFVSSSRLVSKLFPNNNTNIPPLGFLEDTLVFLQSSIPASPTPIDHLEAMMMQQADDTAGSIQLMKGYFVLGNVLSLIPLFFKAINITNLINELQVNQSNKKYQSQEIKVLMMLIDLMDLLFYQYPLPGVLQGNAGIMWHRTGTSHSAVGIPYLFTVQMMQLYDLSAIRGMFLLLFPAYLQQGAERELNWEKYQIAKEVKEIEDSFTTNSSYTMIQHQLEETKTSSASVWLQPSKWASKLGFSSFMTNLTTTSTSTSFSSAAPVPTWSSSTKSSNTSSASSSWFSFLTGGVGGGEGGKSSGKGPAEKVTTLQPATQTEGILIPTKVDILEMILPLEISNKLINVLLMLVLNGNIAKMESIPWKAISFLTFSLPSIPYLWLYLQQQHIKNNTKTNHITKFMATFQPEVHFFVLEDAVNYAVLNSKRKAMLRTRFPSPFNIIYLFASILKLYLVTLDDLEFYEQQKPIPIHQMITVIPLLNHFLYQILKLEPFILYDQSIARREQFNNNSSNTLKPLPSSNHPSSSPSFVTAGGYNTLLTLQEQQDYYTDIYALIVKNIQFVLTDFYTRWSRKPFYSPKFLWIVSETESSWFKQQLLAPASSPTIAAANASAGGGGGGGGALEPFAVTILKQMPWSIPLTERLQYLRNELDRQKLSIQGSNDTSFYSLLGLSNDPHQGFRSKGTVITIHRDRLLNDSMHQLTKLTSHQWKDRLVIRYIDSFGNEEKGIDIGGLFKDFVTDLTTNIIFNTSYGLFINSNDQLLYPNPYSHILYTQNLYELDETYRFLGRVLGKAIYENITISPQFTYFFLSFMNGKYNFMNLLSDLRTLDPELYKNLMFLKSYEGDVSDLALTFSITDTSFGLNQEIQLIPNGSNIDVSTANRLRYIHLVAKYYLHDRLKRQAGAFFSGLYEIIPVDLLNIFCPPELQILISGSQTSIDIDDLQSQTQYSGGYHSLDLTIIRFWKIVKAMSYEEQSLLLRFVTACPRPPSLGFSSLQPKFTIQKIDNPDNQRLPSASTCFNILKLPSYSSEQLLKEKLLYAITSKSGFDLS